MRLRVGGVGTGWGHMTTTILKGHQKKTILTTKRTGWKGWINAYAILL